MPTCSISVTRLRELACSSSCKALDLTASTSARPHHFHFVHLFSSQSRLSQRDCNSLGFSPRSLVGRSQVSSHRTQVFAVPLLRSWCIGASWVIRECENSPLRLQIYPLMIPDHHDIWSIACGGSLTLGLAYFHHWHCLRLSEPHGRNSPRIPYHRPRTHLRQLTPRPSILSRVNMSSQRHGDQLNSSRRSDDDGANHSNPGWHGQSMMVRRNTSS